MENHSEEDGGFLFQQGVEDEGEEGEEDRSGNGSGSSNQNGIDGQNTKIYLDFFYIRTSFRNMNQYYKDEFSKFFSKFTNDKKALGSYEKCYMATTK